MVMEPRLVHFVMLTILIEAVILMMHSHSDFTGPVNIGNPDEFTIKELSEKIIDLTKSKSNIIYIPLPQDDPKKRQPDITLAKKELGWSPKISLDDELKETINYFRRFL